MQEAKKLDRAAVYRGALLVFRQVPAMVELSELALRFAAEAGADVRSAMADSEANVALCRRFEREPGCQRLMLAAMEHVGVDVSSSYEGGGRAFVDRLRLRVQPSREEATFNAISDAKPATGRFSESLPVHRDTWASNIDQQINMWGPLTQISAERTMRYIRIPAVARSLSNPCCSCSS